MELELIGALKIKDGLFVGDEFAAQDLEFVVANKSNFIINCAARQIPNHWEAIGVKYQSFYWSDSDSQILFDGREDRVKQIFSFIEQALNKGESILVHSVRGQNRCICVVAVYLMKKYHWSLEKTLDFLQRRRPDIQIRPSFMQQLKAVESRLLKQGLSLTGDWDTHSSNIDELVLTNTYLNARSQPQEEIKETSFRQTKIHWAEGESTSCKNPVEDGLVIIKSCIKGRGFLQSKVPVQKFKVSKPKKQQLTVLPNKVRAIEDIHKFAESLKPEFIGKKKEETKKMIRAKTEVSTEKKRRPLVNQARRPASPFRNKNTLKLNSEKKVKKINWQI